MTRRIEIRRSGFSLIELMIALTIIALLAGVALPSYRAAVCKVRRGEGRSALLRLMQQQEQVYTQRTAYVAFSAASQDADGQQFKWFSGESPATSAYEIEALPCAGRQISDCVMLVARPGTARVSVNFSDPLCGTLRLDSNGRTGADGNGCW